MSIDRSRRVAFDEAADLFDEVRPTYPDELIDDIINLSHIPDGGRILEVGCGTGQATVSFAQRGYSVVAVELGQRLAALAARNLEAFPRVKVVNASFEDWPLEEKAFDLMLSATAFHWIPPEVGYPKAAQALKDTGSAALFWPVYPPEPQETELTLAISQVYRQIAPDVENPEADTEVVPDFIINNVTRNFAAAGGFTPPVSRQYPFLESYTSETYIKQLRTWSGHRGVDEGLREKLYSKIAVAIDQHGGVFEIPKLLVLMFAGIKRP